MSRKFQVPGKSSIWLSTTTTVPSRRRPSVLVDGGPGATLRVQTPVRQRRTGSTTAFPGRSAATLATRFGTTTGRSGRFRGPDRLGAGLGRGSGFQRGRRHRAVLHRDGGNATGRGL